MASEPRYIRWFEGDSGWVMSPEVGGKNASLGELYRELTPMGVNVPNGFAITASAYRDTLDAAGVWERLATLMGGVDKADVGDLAVRARMARGLGLLVTIS